MVAKGTFREDLLYRINTIHIEIPPLRERGNDILQLAESFLRKYGSKYSKGQPKILKVNCWNTPGRVMSGNYNTPLRKQ